MQLHRRFLSLLLLVIAAGLLAAFAAAALACSTTTLHATLSGKSEVPKGSASAGAPATLTLTPSKGKDCWAFSKLKGFTGANAAHIHLGAPGVAGDVVVPLGGLFKKTGCQNGIAAAKVKAIASNPSRYYVNIHNAAKPAGVVRGQLHS